MRQKQVNHLLQNSIMSRMRTNRVPNQPQKNLQLFAKVAFD